MKYAIICSKKDFAGMTIKKSLLSEFAFIISNESFRGNGVYSLNLDTEIVKLYTLETETVYTDDLDISIDADIFIFATRHQSASGVHSLSVHAPGNWGGAEFGGKPRRLCVAPAGYLKNALQTLEKFNTLGFEVIQECTHHGPYMNKPCLFIEIGSDESSWVRQDAGSIIARTIIQIIENPLKSYRVAVGIGGLHHTPNFKKYVISSDIALSHVCPKYNLENLDKEMILAAIDRTSEKVDVILVDWKGLKAEKQRIVAILEEIGIKWERV